MFFKDIIGQDAAKRKLTQNTVSGRIPHAQLFLGAEGSGALPLALAYIQYILCENRTEDDSCGICPACNKTAKMTHPDVHFSFPAVANDDTKAKDVLSAVWLPQFRKAMADHPYLDMQLWLNIMKAENKQGNINTAECNDIIRKLSLQAYQAEYKILLMWLPEYLGKEGNRLLKIIEEPPANTLFILVAEQQDLLLPTIISRCQLLKVPALGAEEIAAALIQRENTPSDRAYAAAFTAEGSYTKALELIEDSIEENGQLFLEWLRACWAQKSGSDLMRITEKLSGVVNVQGVKYGRKEQKLFVQYALHFVREMLRLKALPDEQPRLREHEVKPARSLAGMLSVEQAADITDLLNHVAFAVERNANPKILFLDTTIQLMNILKPKA